MRLPGPTQLLRRALDYATTSARVVREVGLFDGMTPAIGLELARRAARRGVKGPWAVIGLHALAHPQLPAISDHDVRLSYGELGARIARLGAGLARLGVGVGDKVALLLHNGHEVIEASAALAEIGATAVPVGYRLKAKEIAYILENSGAKALIFHAAHAATVEEAQAEARTPPRTACVAAPGPAPDDGGPRPEAPGFLSYAQVIASGDPAGPPRRPRAAAGGFMIYTSGTTGRAKGADRAFADTGLEPVVRFVGELPIARGERHLVVCPLYHSAATAFAAITFFAGGCVVIRDHFDPHAVLDTMERERITSAMMVPTMFNRLVALGPTEVRRRDLSSLRWLMSGAAPLPTELARRIEECFGPVLYNFYGATETGFVTIAGPGEHTARPGTIGRGVGSVEIRLLDEAGHEVRTGEIGELYVKSAMLVGGYHGNESATKSAKRDGFFSVGDLARRDADGYYYLADRKHDMVISGGVNIYPLEIEQRIHSHPAVSEAAVVGFPDPDWGETLAAFVVLRDGMHASAEEIQAFVTAELADFKRPRKVIFVDALPRNPTGKVLRRELRLRLAPPGPEAPLPVTAGRPTR